MNRSEFRVKYRDGTELGKAMLIDDRASYKADPKAFSWFEAKDDAWLREFQRTVRKLCKSVGHVSKFSISEDVDSGIVVERL